jgi:glycosyl transferase family 25
MKIFVVSLPNDFERRAAIEQQLRAMGFEYTLFDAVLGSERYSDPQWYDDASARKFEGRSLRAGEVGCALSHAAIYAEIVRLNLPWALILEDDAILHDDLKTILYTLERGLIRQGDIISLSRCDQYKPWTKRSLIGRYALVEPILVREGSTAQTVGYIITREAARAIATINIPVRFPADSWGYYKRKVRFLGVIPTLTLITQNTELGSTITADGKRIEFKPYGLGNLIWHGFKTYNPIGKRMKIMAKRFLER